MTLHSPELERRLRKATREAIRASTSLRREARRRRRAQSRVKSSASGLLRLMASALLVGVMAVGAVHDVSLNYKLAIVALWGVVTVAFQAGRLKAHLYGDATISPLVLLPVSDSFIFRWQSRTFLRKNLAVWIDCAAAFGFLSILSSLGASGWVVVPLLATVQWLIILALAIAYVGHPLRGFRIAELLVPVLCLGFFLLVVDKKFSGPRLASWIDSSSSWLTLILPTGWSVTVFDRVILKHEWVALVLISPMALVLALGFRSWKQLRQNYGLHFGIGSAHPPESETDNETPAPPSMASAGPTEILDGIQMRTFLRASNLESQGPIERLVASRLTERDNLLVESMSSERIRWSQRWRRAVWFMAGGMLVSSLMQRLDMAWFAWVDGFTLLVAAGLTLSTGIRVSAALPGAMPVSFREIARLKMKLAFARCLTALPLFAIYGALLAWRLGQSTVAGASLGAKAVALLAAVTPFFIAASISSGTNDTKAISFRSLWLLVVLVGCGGAILGFGAAAVIADFAGGPMWVGWACVPGVAGASSLFLAYYQRQFNRGRFDITELTGASAASWTDDEEEMRRA